MSEERSDSIDRLLKGARSGDDAGDPTIACVDAEQLAAWTERALPEADMRAIETHLASCGRCQAIAATFAATDDVDASPAATRPTNVVPFGRRVIRLWLPLAAGTLAATLLIWVGMRDRSEPTQQREAKLEANATPLPSAATAPVAPPASDLQTQTKPSAAAKSSGAPARSKERQLADKPKTIDELRSDRRAEITAATPTPTPLFRTAQAPPPPPPPLPAPRSVAAAELAAAAPTLVVEFASMNPAQVRDLMTKTTATTGRAAGGGGGRGGGGAGGRGGVAGAAANTISESVALTPVHWRLLSSGAIQKSLDGTSWEIISVDPPVQNLTNGAAPSPLVCWIVGRNGLVLVTTDGKTFRRATPPADIDLVSITAIDGNQASVTAADGRQFTTTDGGKSWTQK